MIIETKPNIKIVELTGVTSNTTFDVPARHWIMKAHCINRDTGAETIAIKLNGPTIANLDAQPSTWSDIDFNNGNRMFETLQTFDVQASDWTDITADILVVLMDLSI